MQQSWENVSHWYDTLVGAKGQYFHQHVIFPKLLPLLDLRPGMNVLDVACGQGVLARLLADKGAKVTGVDSSRSLLESAQKYASRHVTFHLDDARSLSSLKGKTFDRITCILAIQNIDPIDGFFTRVRELLSTDGSCTIVMLHPMFRSPRITGWGEDLSKKLQFRRVDRYLSPMKIPIDMHPGKRNHQLTWTYHRPLQAYSEIARQNGLAIDAIEEWVSDKQSEGKFAKMENLARSEIPMFMAIRFTRSQPA